MIPSGRRKPNPPSPEGSGSSGGGGGGPAWMSPNSRRIAAAPCSTAPPTSPARSRGTISSRMIRPDWRSVSMPSSPRPTSMRSLRSS
jgi:hypothetical protein